MTTTAPPQPGYVLGHSREELERLERQGAFLRAPTLALFQRAGLKPGMRVLDYGCGSGDSALLAAELVGPGGEVVGFDRSAEAVEVSRSRALLHGHHHARFLVGDEQAIAAQEGDRPFDALVGRLVLIHQPDVTAALQKLARLVRPEGIVAFLEIDIEAGHWTTHPNPLLAQLWRWIEGLVSRKIFPSDVGRRLHAAFDTLDVVQPLVIREGRLVKATDEAANAWVAGFARNIAELVRKLGVARVDDLPIDVLLEQLARDSSSTQAFNVGAHLVAASGTLAPA